MITTMKATEPIPRKIYEILAILFMSMAVPPRSGMVFETMDGKQSNRYFGDVGIEFCKRFLMMIEIADISTISKGLTCIGQKGNVLYESDWCQLSKTITDPDHCSSHHITSVAVSKKKNFWQIGTSIGKTRTNRIEDIISPYGTYVFTRQFLGILYKLFTCVHTYICIKINFVVHTHVNINTYNNHTENIFPKICTIDLLR